MVLILDLVNLKTIVVEENCVLRIYTVSEIIALKNSLELTKKLQGVFNGSNNLEVLVDVFLQLSLNSRHFDVEFDKVTIEGVVMEVEKLVVLLLEG